MKTERRHELKHNQLADALGSEIDTLRPYYKTILAVLLAVVVVGVTIAILSNQRTANNAAAWGNFYDVVADGNTEKMPAKLDSLAKAYSGTPAASWAELAAGDLKLQSGSAKMFSDRKEAEKDLGQAKQHFNAVLNEGVKEPMLVRRAKFGLAQTLETMNEPEEAQPLYEELAKENPEDAFGKAATERLAQLNRLNDKQWYAWFAQQKPAPPPADPLQGSGPLDQLPSSNNLRNNLNAPGIIGSELMEDDDTSTEPGSTEPGIEFDAPKTNKTPAEPKKDDAFPIDPANNPAPPADDAKADDKKAEEPAAETPAETPPAVEKADEPKVEEKPAEEPAEGKAEEKPAEESADADKKADEPASPE